MARRIAFTRVVALLLLSVFLAACTTTQQPAASGTASGSAKAEPIKVGLIDSYEQAPTFFTEDTRAAAQQAVEEINRAGGILGRPIELLIRNDKVDPAEARRLARDLIVRDQVSFLVGTTAASTTLAVSEVAKAEKVLFFNHFAQTTTLTEEKWHPYVFRAHTNAQAWCGILGTVAGRKTNFKRWATIDPDYEWGRNCSEHFLAALRRERPDIQIVDRQWPRFLAPDMSGEIAAVLAKQPEAVFSSVWGGQMATLLKQMKAAGAFQKVELFGIVLHSVAASLGKEFPSGVWGSTVVPFDFKPMKAFQQSFKARTGHWPSDGAVFGSLPYYFLKTAAEKAGSLKTDDLVKALRGLSVDTPIGTVTIRAWDHQGNLDQCAGRFVAHPSEAFSYIAEPTCVSGDELLITRDEWRQKFGKNYDQWKDLVSFPEQ